MKQDKRKIILSMCLIFNLTVFLTLCILGKPMFATNDDYRMRLIISGSYTGNPSGEAVFISYILGSALALLYKVLPNLEWYGFFIMASMYIPVCLCEYIFFKRVKKIREVFERSIIIIIFTFLILQKHILMPQFTITSAFWAMLAIAAVIEIFNIYYSNHVINKKWLAVFAVSCIMSCLIRKKVFYLCIPMLILLLIIYGQKYQQIFQKKVIISVIGIILAIFINEGVGMALNLNSEFKAFSDYNKARSSIYDYSGVPDYWENEEFYKQLGVDEAAWENLNNRTFDISESLNTENLEKIYDYAKSMENKAIGYKVWNSINDIRNIVAGKNVFLEVIAFNLIIVMLLKEKICRIRDNEKQLVLSFIIYIVIAIIGLAFVGRIVDRIIESMLLFVIGAALSVGSNITYIEKKSWFYIWKFSITSRLLLNMGMICITVVAIIANQYTLQRDDDGLRAIVIKRTNCLEELTKYMDDKQDDFLFYNALDFIAGSEKVFTTRENKILNIDSLGNWNAFSPNYFMRNEQFGFSSAIEGLCESDNVYYAEIGEYHANIGSELEERGKILQCVDELYVDEDTIYIYKVENKTEGE